MALQITTNDTHTLSLQDRSRVMGAAMGLGVVIALGTVITVPVLGTVDLLSQQPTPTFLWMRLVGLIVVFTMGCGFVVMGASAALAQARGTTCTLDHRTKTVTLDRPQGISMEHIEHSLYGVAKAAIEENEELHVYAVYLVLRSGERLLLGVCDRFQQDDAQRIRAEISAFIKEA